MKKLLFLIIVCSLQFGVWAQSDREQRPSSERIEKFRSKFIKAEMKLTAEEEAAFWPLYEEYRKEMDQIRWHFHEMHQSKVCLEKLASMTDDEASKHLENQMQKEQQYLQIRQKYYAEFKKVLPVKKVAIFFQAEVEFRRRLIKRLSKRQHKKGKDKSKSKSKG